MYKVWEKVHGILQGKKAQPHDSKNQELIPFLLALEKFNLLNQKKKRKIDMATFLLTIILALFAILGYITKVREFIGERHGRYVLGFTDGIIFTLFLIALAFCVGSLITS
jgi:heme/copper-type cytochrome/quinol oxidase subunit 4